MLTSSQIIKEGLITNVPLFSQTSQMGIDLEIIEVYSIMGVGIISAKEKPILPSCEPIRSSNLDFVKNLFGKEFNGWLLQSGYYKIKMNQGCSLNDRRTMLIKETSPISESKAFIQSSLFASSEKTNNIEVFLNVVDPVIIEYGAIVGRAYIFASE